MSDWKKKTIWSGMHLMQQHAHRIYHEFIINLPCYQGEENLFTDGGHFNFLILVYGRLCQMQDTFGTDIAAAYARLVSKGDFHWRSSILTRELTKWWPWQHLKLCIGEFCDCFEDFLFLVVCIWINPCHDYDYLYHSYIKSFPFFTLILSTI